MTEMDIPVTVFLDGGAGRTVVVELDGVPGGVVAGSVELSPAQARALAADLVSLAAEAESGGAAPQRPTSRRPRRPSSVSVTQHLGTVADGSTVIGYCG